MSRISDQIRAYVDDPDVAIHYGAWGALRPDQRRLIRNLCDTCDMYEKVADSALMEREELKKAYANYEETTGLKQAKQEVAREIFEEIEKLLYIGIVEHVNCIDTYVKKGYVELKKKYVPDTDDGTKVSSGDICVVCGEHVPEGRQICSMCETAQEFWRKRKGDDVGL